MGIFLSINLYIKMIGLATSFAERQNLTMHMQMLRFTRSTNAFSKKFEHYGYMVAIYAVFYNWLRVHKTLRGTPAMAAGLLHFYNARPTLYGLEMHLVMIHKLVQEFSPQLVIVDPITNFANVGDTLEVKAVLMRLVDYLKTLQVTALVTSLTDGSDNVERSEVGISSLMDLWILLKMIETNGERNRGIYVLKARGMAHSNQVREFRLSSKGIEVLDTYLGSGGVLTGTARTAQEAADQAVQLGRQLELERKRRDLERKRALLEANIRALQVEFAAEEEEVRALLDLAQQSDEVQLVAADTIARQRGHDPRHNSG